jgi:hypothetical protein
MILEEKPKTRKDLRREREILNMTEEELSKYIEKSEKTIKGLEKHLERSKETEYLLNLSEEERERIAHEYAMKNFPEYEEKYQKWKKEQNKDKK